VWRNDGTTPNDNGWLYEWYLIVATDTANTGRVYMGGCLEYDETTRIAKKALRGASGAGYVDAAGYPTVTAGGAEMTFALGSFTVGTSYSAGNLAAGISQPAAAVTGNFLRVIVTGQVAWVWWGSATAHTYCFGVGTYQNLHSTASDLKPLAYVAHSGGNGSSGSGGTVWQSPLASGSYIRGTNGLAGGGTALGEEIFNRVVGKVGSNGTDIGYDGVYIGTRMHLIRESENNGGGGTNLFTVGWSVGLAPDPFLIFGRQAGTAIGDTVTVNGVAYESVSTPAAYWGLFVNTQA
jgi:hypothetical protein